MKLKHSARNWIVLLSLLILNAGCATPTERIIVEYETVEIVRDRYVSVPERMTKPIETIPLSADFDVWELGAVAKARKVRILQCNGQLVEIANLGREE